MIQSTTPRCEASTGERWPNPLRPRTHPCLQEGGEGGGLKCDGKKSTSMCLLHCWKLLYIYSSRGLKIQIVLTNLCGRRVFFHLCSPRLRHGTTVLNTKEELVHTTVPTISDRSSSTREGRRGRGGGVIHTAI